jgi:hypothetical protein
MEDLKQLTALVWDYGNFFSVAERISRDDGFGRTYYFVPKIVEGFPTHRPYDIGRNVPGVICVDEWASVIDECDIIIFPDSHEGALQEWFAAQGKKVFGCRRGCDLEHNRDELKDLMKQLELPVNDYEVAYGLDELEEILKRKENVFVKSKLRGDSETWKHTEWKLSKIELDRMRKEMGVYQNKETYIVEDPIESLSEIGWDGFVVDGMFPEKAASGIELKDTGYLGKITRYSDLPHQLKIVTDKFQHIFRDLGYRGAYSNEVIIGQNDRLGYLIDNTCRCPEPNTSLALEWFTNYPQIIWDVANGRLPKIKYDYEWGVQFIIKSDLAKTEPSPVIVSDEYKKFVKIKNLVIDEEGTWYFTPNGTVELCEIGAVVGLGNSMDEAIEMAKQIASSIRGFDIKINTDCIEEATEQLYRLESAGISYLK